MQRGTFSYETTVEVTDEEWEDGIDTSNGKVVFFDTDLAVQLSHQQHGDPSVCAQCSGWRRPIKLTLETEEMKLIEITDPITNEVIYE